MCSLVGNFFSNGLLPEQFARLPVKAHDVEFVRGIRWRCTHPTPAPAGSAFTPALRLLSASLWLSRRRRFFFGGHGSLNENLIAPDNGRRVAMAGQRGLPFYVFSLAPGGRWVAL